VLFGQGVQFFFGGMCGCEQSIQTGCDAVLDLSAVDQCGSQAFGPLYELQTAQCFQAPQSLIKKRALRFDQMRLKQKCAYFTGGLCACDVSGLSQHAGLIRISQVRHHA
jgi:hypothetical protein